MPDADEIQITTIEKSTSEEIRVRLRTWKGRWQLDSRVFYAGKDGEMLPGRAGIALNLDILDDFVEALHLAQERIAADGMK